MNGFSNNDGSHINGSDFIQRQANDYTGGLTNSTSADHMQDVTRSGRQIPVVICGLAMRLPGGIRDDRALYDFLINKGDARSIIGQDRYNVDAYYNAHGKHGTISTKYGYFLNDVDFSNFDTSMFTLTSAEAEQLDPNHRLALEVVREAFESAGEIGWRGKNIGVYVGMFSEDWQELQHKDTQEYSTYRVLGGLDFALPNRISYEYNLRGPSLIVKTACSSAGLSLHLALQAIQQGEISSAIVCGANLILAPGMTITMSLQLTLSPEGSCKSFDASADGYARGEGVNALYIKRLDEAIRDKNPVRAVIGSSASNTDGKTNGMALPNPEAHKAVIRQAYKSANLDMSETAMVEAHGTGTKIGDPLEVKAIANCFGDLGLYLGAVEDNPDGARSLANCWQIKPNLGHGEGAAAITTIMKAVISLEHRTIIPNIKFNVPNPAIPFKAAKLVVPVEPCPWPKGRAERVSINSYGIGGANAHFILDSAASFGIQHRPVCDQFVKPKRQHTALLLFSANHPESLSRVAANIENYCRNHPDHLDDLAYTLAHRREHLKLRTYCVVGDPSAPFAISDQAKSQGLHQIAFIFTGQGAQWIHMGRKLMLEYSSFLEDIRRMDRLLRSLDDGPSWSIEGKFIPSLLNDSEDHAILARAERSQPICAALQIGLVNLLATWHVSPSAVIGHSSGEIAAAYAAGALNLEDAIITAYYGGHICKEPQNRGGMAAVGMGKEELAKYLLPGISIACENSGLSVTISGDSDVLETVMSNIKAHKPNVLVKNHMNVVGDRYYNLIAKHISPQTPKIAFYSSVTSKVLRKASDFGPQYWQANLERPVLFHSAVRKLLMEAKECSAHLEIGPHAALQGPLRHIYSEMSMSVNYVSTLIRGKNDTLSFLEAIGQLHSLDVQASYPFSENAKVLIDLPNYPWHYERSYWSETRIMKNWRFRKHPPHDLLGLRVLEGNDISPTWRNELRLADVPWLKDYCVGHNIVFPGAGYIAMAGEAVFQISGVRDYTVRDVELSKAMVLFNDKPVEITTMLQPQRLTSILNSDWHDFQIVSYDGTNWNKHCSGLVRSGCTSGKYSRGSQSFDRQISASRWYTTMSRVGLNYGPRFTGLNNITASITGNAAAAEIIDKQEVAEPFYTIHPSTLDFVFQSLIVASCRGIYRDLRTLFLPTFIEELCIAHTSGKVIQVKTNAASKSGAVEGNSHGISGDEMVFSLKGFRGKATENSGVEKPPEIKMLQLQWKPHYEFLKAGELMRLRYDSREQIQHLERLYVLCAIETRDRLLGVSTTHSHLTKYRAWLDQQYERFQKQGYPLVNDSNEIVSIGQLERRQQIPKILELCHASGGCGPAAAIWKAYDQVVNVFSGRVEYLDVLLQNGVLNGVYDWYNNIWDFKDFMQILGHTQQQMRILEIGAGTGGMTAKALEFLKSDFGEQLYQKYTFTDISSGFFVQAKERFKDYEGIEYIALDISKDPLKQGFTTGEYNLIIASNGQFSGWWLSEEDGRQGCPFISPEEWDKRLRGAGFAGCDSVTLDNEQPYTYSANIIAKPALAAPIFQEITLLATERAPSLASDVESLFRAQSIDTEYYQWGQQPPSDQDLICFFDLGERPLLRNVKGEDLAYFLKLVDSYQQSKLLWLTPPAQMFPTDPHSAQILGMARTIRAELAMSFATLELENSTQAAASVIVSVMQKIQKFAEDDTEIDTDLEYAWMNKTCLVGRFHWMSVKNSLSESAEPIGAKGLEIGTPGLLQTLKWKNQYAGALEPDEVNIKISAVGLNFKDIMHAMGIVNGAEALKKGSSPFGLEGSGIISGIGSNITNFAVGDRVLAIGSESIGMATVIQRPAILCVKIPDQLSDEEAATMPIVYVTVLIFLVEKWKLNHGQSILIHSAAGGVGICAMNIAKWIGAEIYATVGSKEKASFLMSEFGIPRNRIFNSRDTTFLDGIMEATNGLGVDVVLNSLSGELLHTSWKCVAPNGAMIEVGKRDMVGRGQLALAPFEDNRAFLGGDIARLLVTHKNLVARLLDLMMEQLAQGNFKPITPITTFEAEQAQEAFRFMQKGSHIGKIVIKFPKGDSLPVTHTIPAPQFRGDKSYLLAGGLGGLGKAIAGWMASYGAKNLIFLSRSAGKSENDRASLEELNMMGCSAQCFVGDVADHNTVQNAIDHATSPIAGAMQMAMVLQDVGVLGMDIDSWNTATSPKIEGTWNLHNLLPRDMDFFVLFSSVCGTFGHYGQANYASANTFLDSFVQYRQSLGLAASVLDIGPIDEIGYVSRNQSTRETLLATLDNLTTEQDFLDTLQLAINRSSTEYAPSRHSLSLGSYQNPSHIVHATESRIPIMDPQNFTIWKRDPRMAIYRNIQRTSRIESEATADYVKHFLSDMMRDSSRLDKESSVKTIARELGTCISSFLNKGDEGIDMSSTLDAVGVDSLVAIEVRNWWKQNLGIDVSVLELMNGGSIEELGRLAAKRLKDKFTSQ